MLYAMTKAFNHWDQWTHTTLASVNKFTETANQLADQTARWQFYQYGACMLTGLKQFRQAWEVALPHKTQTKKASGQRVALVTGGIGGIGSAICKKLSQDGHFVIATYHPAEVKSAIQWQQTRKEEGFTIALAECDVADFDACTGMTKQIESDYGTIDILVNCAGITRDNTLRKMDKTQWDAVLDTNLDSVFNVTRNVVDKMVERGFGRIINISSINGHKGQFGQTNYAAAKAGMLGFTKSLARELADVGVTVNTVSPGYIATSMVMTVPEEIRTNIAAKIPLGRFGEPEEIARAVAFLAEEGSGYITGTDIAVNGGLFMS